MTLSSGNLAGKHLLQTLLPIHTDKESGFVIRDKVFRSQELVRLAVTAVEEVTELCNRYVELRKESLRYPLEFSLLGSQIKEVRMVY